MPIYLSCEMRLTWESYPVLVLLLVSHQTPSIDCWKPIVGQSTTYSLHQSHPGFASQSHSINTIGGSDIPLEFTSSDGKLPSIIPTDPSGVDEIFGYKYQDPRQVMSSIFGEVRPLSVCHCGFESAIFSH